MTAQSRPPWDPDPRYVANVERVRPACPYCGDEIFVGEYSDPVTGRCRHCVGRSGSVFGIIAFFAVVAAAAALIALVGWAAASRSGPAPSHPAPAQIGAPRPPTRLQAPTEAGAPRFAGTATWYCGHGSPCTKGYRPSDLVAAIDTDLGFDKGDRAIVRFGDKSVTVRIVDVCRCPGERLIDLTTGAFKRLAPLGLGVLSATVERAKFTDGVTPMPLLTLPATDVTP